MSPGGAHATGSRRHRQPRAASGTLGRSLAPGPADSADSADSAATGQPPRPGSSRGWAARLGPVRENRWPLLLGVAGTGLWGLSLRSVDLARMTDYGLLPALPPTWYLGVGLILAGAVLAVCRREPRELVVALLLAALVMALYGTIPLVAELPQYAWSYKHFGVTQYIELHGSVDPSIDIYHRWPGFFALTAMFSTVAGAPDPIAYAAWSEVFFTAGGALLVAAIGHRLLRSARLGWLAALFYVITNWVGQSYFAPQAVALLLALGGYLLVLDRFGRPRPTWPLRALLRLPQRLRWPAARVEALCLPGPEPAAEAGAPSTAPPTPPPSTPGAAVAPAAAGTGTAPGAGTAAGAGVPRGPVPADTTMVIARRPAGQPAPAAAGMQPVSPDTATLLITRRPAGGQPAGGAPQAPPAAGGTPAWPRGVALALVLLTHFAIVASHQLTPYVVVLGVVVMVVLGVVRPWWLAALLAAVTVGYLLPHLGYVEDRFGVFTGFDPLDNVQTSGVEAAGSPMPGKVFFTRMGTLLTATMLLLGLIGVVRGLRRGEGNVVVPIGFVVAAGLPVLGQSYGGEGALRVVLFAGPWLCVLAARALAPVSAAGWSARRAAVVLPVTGLVVALFLPSFFGQSELNIQDPDQVAALEYTYAHGEPGTPLFAGVPHIPASLAGNYDEFPGGVPTLVALGLLSGKEPTPADITRLTQEIGAYGEHSYLLFSDAQQAYLTINESARPDALRAWEDALLKSGHLTLWYEHGSARVYDFSRSRIQDLAEQAP